MTIEQIKAAAKERLGKDITDEQAEKWLTEHPVGELTDDELENVTGGDSCMKTTGQDAANPFAMEERQVADGLRHFSCPRCGRRDGWTGVRKTDDLLIAAYYTGTCACGGLIRLKLDKFSGAISIIAE
ncbi:MAG: hypothetical protein LBS19_11100 [Clostridiales bacterium]|jgi:bacteriocin-like protein|nr:hypothetical protein [Clostridiales bacterium]